MVQYEEHIFTHLFLVVFWFPEDIGAYMYVHRYTSQIKGVSLSLDLKYPQNTK